ncbi:hypothetical protein N7494_003140 [Penicillium frequentans]|uniref:Xylanolytic transcriptional activator regulatory domain-containing protein n=1 Tax=Penicillium frequentans TaxID=3151616 RepID=A0AAD6D5C5_9EURO|nr:hypothetical protein N7494_003140 [Penicillium glabrum]
MDLGFDLYNASCDDAAIHLADHCVSIITGLGSALQIYLLDQFWIHFNSCIPVVHKATFLTSLEEAYGDFCSPELHLAVLAMGLRRADHKRSDVLQLFLPNWDSILHKKLRLVIDNLSTRKERQSITYAQTLIILAQLEWERGRDHTARLHLTEIRNLRHELDMAISDDEIIAQRIALRAVSLIDSHTVLFNHNFNTILDDRSSISNFATVHRLRINPQSSTQTQDLSSQIFNAHLELMSITTNGIEQLQSQQTRSTDNPFSRLTALHNRLQSCQQFHAILILLYRPYSLQNSLASIMLRFKDVNIDQLSEEIHNILLTNAMQIADLILESRKRFELGAIFPLSVQQGALAAGVLLTMSRVAGNCIRDSSLRYLQYLQQFFSEMSAINGPAERLDRTLHDLTATSSSCDRPTQRRTQSVDITNSGRPGTETSIGGPNDTLCLHRSDDNGQGSLPGCAADQQGTTAAYAYTKDNGAPRSGLPDDLDPTRDLEHRTVPPPPATNTSINIRSLSQSSDRCINAMESESMPSSHTVDRGLNHLTPVDISLEEGGYLPLSCPSVQKI